MVLTRGSLLLIPLQLRKNHPEISSIHREKEKIIIKGGGVGVGKNKEKKIPVKVTRSNLGLLQKLLVLQEQHPESTKNKWDLELHDKRTESPSA